jgi:hypothetical protein
MPKLWRIRVVAALLVPDQDHAPTVDPRQPADDRLVFAVKPVAAERQELVERETDIIDEVRAHRMAGDEGLLPGRERPVSSAEQGSGFLFEPLDLGRDVDLTAVRGRAQLFDPRLERGHRFLKLEIAGHKPPWRYGARFRRSIDGSAPEPRASGWQALTRATKRALSTCV